MVGARLPACTCSVAGVCRAKFALQTTQCHIRAIARLNEKDVQVWQGFSLTMKSRNFVRTNFRCGTGTPSVCTKIALHFAASLQIWPYRNFRPQNSKRPINFVTKSLWGRTAIIAIQNTSRPPQTFCCRSLIYRLYRVYREHNHPKGTSLTARMIFCRLRYEKTHSRMVLRNLSIFCFPFELKSSFIYAIYFESHRQFWSVRMQKRIQKYRYATPDPFFSIKAYA